MSNKPYFVKGLEIEGELIEGGLAVNKIPGADHSFIIESNRNYPSTVRPAKLFLCSRDIQVGDKWYKNGVEQQDTFIEEDAFPMGDYASSLNSYKVIGEISPEATWVKEGDEFDEYRWRWKEDEHYETEYFTEEEKQKGKYEIRNWANVIALKGPCGHFH
jgi:hypothetical protein